MFVCPKYRIIVLPDEPHVTVLYGLIDVRAPEVASAVRRMGSPVIVVGEAIAFDAKNGVVPLVLTVESGQLRQMNTKLRDTFPHVMTYQEYRPHITVAYVREEFADQYCGPNALHDLAIELTRAEISMPGQDRAIVPLKTKEPAEVEPPKPYAPQRKAVSYDDLRAMAQPEIAELRRQVSTLASGIDQIQKMMRSQAHDRIRELDQRNAIVPPPVVPNGHAKKSWFG